MKSRCETADTRPMNLVGNLKGPESREHGRVRCHLTESTLGTVLDLSCSGIRVELRSRPRMHPGDTGDIAIYAPSTTFAVRVRVMWSRRIGWKRHQVGLRFEELTEEVRNEILAVCRESVSFGLMSPDGEPKRWSA